MTLRLVSPGTPAASSGGLRLISPGPTPTTPVTEASTSAAPGPTRVRGNRNAETSEEAAARRQRDEQAQAETKRKAEADKRAAEAVDAQMAEYTRTPDGLAKLHTEAKAAGVPLGKAAVWKRKQLTRLEAESKAAAQVEDPFKLRTPEEILARSRKDKPAGASVGAADFDSLDERSRNNVIAFARELQSSPLAQMPTQVAGKPSRGPGRKKVLDRELGSALGALEGLRQSMYPDVPGSQFIARLGLRKPPEAPPQAPVVADTDVGSTLQSMAGQTQRSIGATVQMAAQGAQWLAGKTDEQLAGEDAINASRGAMFAQPPVDRGGLLRNVTGAINRAGESTRLAGDALARDAAGGLLTKGANADNPYGIDLPYYAQQAATSAGPTLVGLGVGAVTKSPMLGAAVMSGGAAGDKFMDTEGTGQSVSQRLLGAGVAGAAEFLPEKFGLDVMMGKIGKYVGADVADVIESTLTRKMAVAGVTEPPAEMVTEAINAGYEKYAEGKNITREQFWGRLKDAGITGAIMGIGMRGGVGAVEAAPDAARAVRDQVQGIPFDPQINAALEAQAARQGRVPLQTPGQTETQFDPQAESGGGLMRVERAQQTQQIATRVAGPAAASPGVQAGMAATASAFEAARAARPAPPSRAPVAPPPPEERAVAELPNNELDTRIAQAWAERKGVSPRAEQDAAEEGVSPLIDFYAEQDAAADQNTIKKSSSAAPARTHAPNGRKFGTAPTDAEPDWVMIEPRERAAMHGEVADAFTALAQGGGEATFQLPVIPPKLKTIHEITRAVDPTIRVQEIEDRSEPWPGTPELVKTYSLQMPNGDSATFSIDAGGGTQLDVLNSTEGGGTGTPIYAIINTFAQRNGLKALPDHAGLTEVNKTRRTEQQAASALRTGTTEHLVTHPSQVVGGFDVGGDDRQNTGALLTKGMQNSFDAVPELHQLRYNPSTAQFEWTNGEVATDEDFSVLAGSPSAREAGIGRSTLKRAVWAASAVRATRSNGVGAGRLLGNTGGQQIRELAAPTLEGLLYSRGAVGGAATGPQGGRGAGPQVAPRPETGRGVGPAEGRTGSVGSGNARPAANSQAPNPRNTEADVWAELAAQLGLKFARRLKAQPWLRVVNNRSQVPAQWRNQLEAGELVGAFYAPNGDVYVIASEMQDTAAALILHEVGVHYGLSGMLGKDLPAILDAFWAKRTSDPEVAAAIANVPAGTPAKNLREEALAYYVQRNWDKPSSLWTQIMVALKRFASQLGIPISYWDSNPQQLLELARIAANKASRGQLRERFAAQDAAREQAKAPADGELAFSRKPKAPDWDTFAVLGGLANAFDMAKNRVFQTGRDLKLALQNAMTAATNPARIDLSVESPETVKHLTRMAVADARYALKANANAVGWYDTKVSQSLAVLALVHPEIKTEPEAEFAFILALAVTSNGLKVGKNFELAEKAYRAWRETGKMPTDIGIGTAAGAINEGLALFNEKVAEFGWQPFRDFMVSETTVKQIKAAGGDVSGELAATTVRGAAILGPKIGNGFFSNLYGFFDSLTMDRWLMRTWGRWTGNLIEYDADEVEAKNQKLGTLLGMLSPADKRQLLQVVGARASWNTKAIAAAITDASADKKTREALNAIAPLSDEGRAGLVPLLGKLKSNQTRDSIGSEIRKMGNGLTKAIDGQKEAPANGTERNFIRAVFGAALAELQADYPKLTMADLQALLWYPEKRLYDSAKQKDDADEGYNDDEAPDYANAAVGLARAAGVPQADISEALNEAAKRTRAGGRGSAGRPAESTATAGTKPGGPEDAPARLLFEVAPDPNNAELKARWDGLSSSEKARVSLAIAKQIAPKALQAADITGAEVQEQVGGYLDDSNPSLALLFGNRADLPKVVQAARLLGFSLSQDSMMVLASKAFDGSFETGLITVRVPAGETSLAAIHKVYSQIRALDPDSVQGHTTVGREMLLAVPVEAMDRLVEAIAAKLDDRFAVYNTTGHMAFPSKDEYDYGDLRGAQTSELPDGGQGARDLRENASQLLDAALAEGPGQILKSSGHAADTVEVDGVARPTTDSTGKRIHPTDEGIRNFWRWFGDSEVVDAAGRPLVVYHGTTGDFEEFSRIDGGNAYGPGYYFTADPKEASAYATGEGGGRIRPGGEGGPSVMPVYLKADKLLTLGMQNLSPAAVTAMETAANKLAPGAYRKGELSQYFDRGYPATTRNVTQRIAQDTGKSLSAIAQAAGYDSLSGSYGYVVVRPAQIKSATGNTGAFSPDEPRILKSSSRAADTIEVDGVERPATDSTGKRIHPTDEGIRNFWQWFGDSKVVDESAVAKARDDVRAAQAKLDFDDSRLASLADAHPLHPIITRGRAKHAAELDAAKSYLAAVQSSPPPVPVFHGGGPRIEAFRRGGRAIWMAESVAANTYGAGVGGTVYPLYARIENPMIFDAEGGTWQQLRFEGERVSTDDLADTAESRGHDGLIINNLRDEDTDDGGDTPATHYAVFAPEQVKSALGNTGAFDPADKSILKSSNVTVEYPRDDLGRFAPGEVTLKVEGQERPKPASEFSTSTKNEFTDRERADLRKDPVYSALDGRAHADMILEARGKLARDKDAAEILALRLAAGIHTTISEADEALLLAGKVELLKERAKVAERAFKRGASEETRRVAMREWDEIEQRVTTMDQALKTSGSIWGRWGNLRQRILREDFSFDVMLEKAARARGRDLTDAEREEVHKQAENIKELEAALAKSEEMLAEREERADSERLLADMVVQTTRYLTSETKARSRPLLKWLQTMAEESRKALDAMEDINKPTKKGQAGATNVVALGYHLTVIGAAKLAEMLYTPGKWNKAKLGLWRAAMRKELGSRKFTQLDKEGYIDGALKQARKDADLLAKSQVKAVADAIGAMDPNAVTHNDVYELVRAIVKSGVHGEADVMAEATKQLQGTKPGITEREVRRIFVDYGKARFPSQEEVSKEVRELAVMVRLQESIDRLREGLPALKSGPQRDKQTQMVRQRQTELNELLKVASLKGVPDPQRLATYQDARIRNLKNMIEDAERQLATGERPERRPPPPKTPEMEKLAAELKTLREKIREADRKSVLPTPEQRAAKARAEQLKRRIEELQQRIGGAPATKPDPKAKPTSPELSALEILRDNLQEQLNALEREKRVRKTPEERANAARLKGLERQERILKEELLTGLRPPKGVPQPTSAEVDAKAAAVAAIRKQVEAAREAANPKPSPEERYQTTLSKILTRRIADLRAKIEAKDWAPKPKVEREANKANRELRYELLKAKHDFAVQAYEWEMSQRGVLGKLAGYGYETFSVARALMTSVDWSAVLRQSLFTLGHPVLAAKLIKPMVQATFSAAREVEIEDKIRQRPNFALYEKAGLHLTESHGIDPKKVEEQFVGRWLEKANYKADQPIRNAARGVANVALAPVRGSGRAYTTFTNLMRVEMFDLLLNTLTKSPAAPTKAELEAVAYLVNVGTGRGSFGSKALDESKAASLVLFAPRYVASRFNFLLGIPIWKGWTASSPGTAKRVARLAAMEYARYFTGLTAVYALAALYQAGTDDDDEEPLITLDSRSSDFGKIRFGNTYLDPMAGLAQAAVFGARMLTAETVVDGEVRSLGPDRGWGQRGGFDVMAAFARSKLSPMMSTSVNLLTRETFGGEPTTLAGQAMDLAVPLSLRELTNVTEDRGIPEGAMLLGLSMLGMGLQYRDPEHWDNVKELRDQYKEERAR